MLRPTRWFVRSGLLYLVAALVLGAARSWPGGGAWLPATWPLYVHLLTVGWLTQLIFGVAFWMFPQPRSPSGWDRRLIWASYWLLNIGLLLRMVAEPNLVAGHPSGWGALLALAAVLQLIGATAGAIQLWPRVRGRA